MNAVSVPPNRHLSRIAAAVSSGLLSIRRFAGRRPVVAMILSSAMVVSSAVKDRAAVVARASRVNSSMMLAKQDLPAVGGDVDLEVDRPHLIGC